MKAKVLAARFAAIFVLGFTWTASAYAAVFHFEGAVNGQAMSFSTIGFSDLLGTEALFYSFDESIIELSPFVLLTTPIVPGATSLGSDIRHVAQCCDGRVYFYNENVGGYNATTLEYYGHQLIIRLESSSTIYDNIGVSNAFTYDEVTAYFQNFTFDGSTEAIEERTRVLGFLTLTQVDLGNDPPNQAFPPVPVPEPATLALLGLGLAGLGVARRRRAA
ncbi:MAG: PEP-CTERM sorting domain-containing protein [Pirellulales bacterium]|nr:PEP-CTERM sorting domain-containing protein [Pirellulales bacterium]